MQLSKRVKGIKPSATLAITQKAKAMKAKGAKVINFAAGEPDFDTPLYIKKAAKAAIDKGKTKYTPSSGTVALRKAICLRIKKDLGLKYRPDQVVVSNGAKHSLYNIFQALCQKGDEVIIPSPYWVSYPEMVALSGAKPVIAKTDKWKGFKLTPRMFREAITKRTKALILNSPQNPTGCVYRKSELKEIAKIAAKKNIVVISDEIYRRLNYSKEGHVSIASLNSKIKKLTIFVDGVSKAYSMTGWRIGYLASEIAELVSAIKNLQSHSTSNPSSISQEAAQEALSKEDIFAKKMFKEFKYRRDYMLKRINDIKQISCVKPEGAFYCFCDISKTGMDSTSFAKKALDKIKVAVIPGVAFGSPTSVRLSFACSVEDIKEGMDRLEDFINKQ